MRWLVFDCPSGISGDMTLGALVDLGVPLEALRDALATLPLGGYSLQRRGVTRNGVAATQVLVELQANAAPAHRHLHDIVEILQAGKLPGRALEWSLRVFRKLAQAEATVHRVPVEEVHFHEVGAVDAIVDIAGACTGLQHLCEKHGVEGFRVAQLRVGRGGTRTEHGVLPVPPPAVLQLLKEYPICFGETDGERVTPTGAAILAALAAPLGNSSIRVHACGYGAGEREFPDAPNVLRLLLCEPAEEAAAVESAAVIGSAGSASKSGESVTAPAAVQPPRPGGVPAGHPGPAARPGEQARPVAPRPSERVGVLNTTIDDMVPEFFGHLMERLFAAGALDVYFTPVHMKKDRPATQVTVIAEPDGARRLADVLLRESSTLGVRIAYEERVELPRRITSVDTPYGKIQVKVAVRPDGKLRCVPEYESVRRAAMAAGVPLADVYQAALAAEVEGNAGSSTA